MYKIGITYKREYCCLWFIMHVMSTDLCNYLCQNCKLCKIEALHRITKIVLKTPFQDARCLERCLEKKWKSRIFFKTLFLLSRRLSRRFIIFSRRYTIFSRRLFKTLFSRRRLLDTANKLIVIFKTPKKASWKSKKRLEKASWKFCKRRDSI